MFVHPTNDYDFLIKLNRTTLPRYLHNILADGTTCLKQSFKNDTLQGQNTDLPPGFDPAHLLFVDLQVRFINCIFFEC